MRLTASSKCSCVARPCANRVHVSHASVIGPTQCCWWNRKPLTYLSRRTFGAIDLFIDRGNLGRSYHFRGFSSFYPFGESARCQIW